MPETLGDIVGTAGEATLGSYLEALLMTPTERGDAALDRKIRAEWLRHIEARESRERKAWSQQVWPIFQARQKAYEAATEKGVAWLKAANGGWDDVNKAAKLFNSKAVWSKSVRDSDYERLSALVSARNAS